MELLMKLDKCLQKLEGAYAPNTLRSYYADTRMFVDWCSEKILNPSQLIPERCALTSNTYNQTLPTALYAGGYLHFGD